MTYQRSGSGSRPARMRIRSAAMMIRGADAWSTEIADISATGVLLVRPENWQGNPGDLYALDMIVGEELNIHVEATVARITTNHLGFAYARIPPDKEVPLWNLLGGYADKIEPFDD
ncbi:MAG: PilZ domain-containing protein [Proteobacteria bacterium]|nr:PilZ domain-containing protein [Pseudomonadota bacterium]